MEVLDAAAVRAGLDPVELVAALREVFAGDEVTVPERTLQSIGSDSSATLLLKPAWGLHGLLGVKVATHHPANGSLGLPSTLVERLRTEGYAADVAPDLRAAVRAADVITTATSATSPLVLGRDVRPGTHVDLVGSFLPDMVEADEELMTAARIVVDAPEARHTAGELAGPLARGTLTESDVTTSLADVVAGRAAGRTASEQITAFVSVGTAAEDLAAAALVLRSRPST